LELLDALGVTVADSVIDVGGGTSTLVDHLLARGHGDLAVVDLSVVALDEARQRVGDTSIAWIPADVRSWQPDRQWEVWHDRAVLHFMVDDDDVAAYMTALRRAVVAGGRS
jgi:trans-aconitate methyltransferase